MTHADPHSEIREGAAATAGAKSSPQPAAPAAADDLDAVVFALEAGWSRDKSSCGGVEGHAATPSRIADRDGTRTSDGRIVNGAGIEPGPQDSNPANVSSPPALATAVVAGEPASVVAFSFDDGIPEFLRRSRNVTTLRADAENLIQASVSSSDILSSPNL